MINSEDCVQNASVVTSEDRPEGERSTPTKSHFDILHFGHHKTPLSLINSADNGCFICKTSSRDVTPSQKESLRATERGSARRSFTKPNDNSNEENQEPEFYTCARIQTLTHGREYSLNIVSKERPLGTIDEFFDIREMPDTYHLYQIKAGDQGFCSYFTDNTGSEKSLQTANWWLQTCLDTHRSCNRESAIASWFPTRLLYLGHSLVYEPYVKLIHTAKEHPTGPYVTLSHRWGGANFLQLNRANMKALQDGLPLETMPKIFQDAVYVSKWLKIRYLWIDSLCISQDDHSDWLREAAVMHHIYSASTCNLSASDAEDSSTGLFLKYDPQTLEPVKFKICLNGLKAENEFAECTAVIESHLWMHHMETYPINRRGWVYQERILSPRVLHFGRGQSSWECWEHNACEKYPLGLPTPDIKHISLGHKNSNRHWQLAQCVPI